MQSVGNSLIPEIGKAGMRTPDAIHFASAMGNHCRWFITNDKEIKSHGAVTVVQISDLV